MTKTRSHYEVRNYYNGFENKEYALYNPTGFGETGLDAIASIKLLREAMEDGLSVKRVKVTVVTIEEDVDVCDGSSVCFY